MVSRSDLIQKHVSAVESSPGVDEARHAEVAAAVYQAARVVLVESFSLWIFKLVE